MIFDVLVFGIEVVDFVECVVVDESGGRLDWVVVVEE